MTAEKVCHTSEHLNGSQAGFLGVQAARNLIHRLFGGGLEGKWLAIQMAVSRRVLRNASIRFLVEQEPCPDGWVSCETGADDL